MTNFLFPTSAELQLIEQDKLPRLMQDRPIFDIMPIRNVDAHLLEWEQVDNYTGLQQVRGLGGDPARVKALGMKQYVMQPGVYGEFRDIDEVQMTARRAPGTFGTPIDIADMVMAAQDFLLGRRLDRIEKIGWDLIANGVFSTFAYDGNNKPVIVHTDAYTLQTYTAGVTWATSATAAPLSDLRQAKLLARGHSVQFGAGAKAYANQTTINNLLLNQNPNDLKGLRLSVGATINSLENYNQILLSNDLPQLVPYDAGYLDDTGTFQLFIPNGKVIVVGQRTSGVPVAEYRMTRNANNPNLAPGAYTKVIDNLDKSVPRRIDVHDGHNGGPVIYFPSAILNMSV